jgi:DNA-binding LacI/PurR family transcriptional regulator/uroporphyrinogen-III decarboxylase
MGITLADVAKQAGVSVTTASLVLSGKGRISDHVRQTVIAAADTVGYARKSSTRTATKAPVIAILVSIDPEWAMVWWFIRPIIEEIEKYYAERKRNTVVIPISSAMTDANIVRRIAEESCDGVFTLHYGTEELLDAIEARGIPIVVIMNGRFQERYHCILADDFQGAYEGTKHLVRLGHQRIAYVDTERENLPVLSSDRFYGFLKGLDEAGLEFSPGHRITYDVDNSAYLEAALHALFATESPPTAIFAIDDDVAIRVISLLGELGIQVPDDVSVIAPGDLLNYSDPHVTQITTLRIDTRMMGRFACEMMTRLSSSDALKHDVHVLKVKQHLVLRGSTRPVRAELSSSVPSDRGKHRARFLSAFATGRSDLGVPRWLGATSEFIERACAELGTDEEGFRRRIGDDLRWLENDPLGRTINRRNVFGIERRGFGYGQPVSHPLKSNPTIKGLQSYPWPEPAEVDLASILARIAAIGDEYAIAGGPWSPFWHDAIDLVGLETLACRMYDDPVFVDTLLGKIVDYYVTVATRLFEEAGDRIDLFFLRNDFGTQTGPMIGPEHFRRFVVPCLEHFTRLGHRFGIKVMLHSSGGILPLIPSIIAAGFDAIHALQPDCPGMQSKQLKRSYGQSIVLSGAIDARNTLLAGDPRTVKDLVRARLEEMAADGGYIAAPSTEAITSDVPVENVIAMFEAIDEFE